MGSDDVMGCFNLSTKKNFFFFDYNRLSSLKLSWGCPLEAYGANFYILFFISGCFLGVLSLPLSTAFGKTSHSERRKSVRVTQMFHIDRSAEVGDWKSFWGNSSSWRQQLWLYYKKRGHKLSDWHWTWRMGWVRACSGRSELWCQKILKRGLIDAAAVVRAKSAEGVYRSYSGRDNDSILKILEKSYLLPGNFKQGKPLFPCFRILSAIVGIAPEKGLSLAKRLASSHPSTFKYVDRLIRAKI